MALHTYTGQTGAEVNLNASFCVKDYNMATVRETTQSYSSSPGAGAATMWCWSARRNAAMQILRC